MISAAEQTSLRERINAIEEQTDAEIVLVLARQSDNYSYISTLWAALIALLLPPLLLLLTAFTALQVTVIQLTVFVLVALILRIRPLLTRLIPRPVRQWRAATLARHQFLDNNLHCTKGQTGVLIFVSLLEHHAQIIADRGIDRAVDQGQWQAQLDGLIAAIRAGQLGEGLHNCVAGCGDLLIRHVPASEAKNELPNHVVIID